MFENVPATTRMPAIGDKPTVKRPVKRSLGGGSSVGFRGSWRSFRRSVHGAVRSVGAWVLAVCVGVLAVSVSWVGWFMGKVSEAVLVSAEVGGRGIQESLPVENGGVWLSLAQIHPGWFAAVPFGFWVLVIVIKEVK